MIRIANTIYNIYKKYIFFYSKNKEGSSDYIKEYAIGAITLMMLFNFMTIGRFIPVYFKDGNTLYFFLLFGVLFYFLNHKFLYRKLKEREIGVLDLLITIIYVIGSFFLFVKIS